MNKDDQLIYEMYLSEDRDLGDDGSEEDEELEHYKDWENLSVAVMEILGDYGMYEYNLRPASTVDKGVEEIKQLVNKHIEATGKDRHEVYNELDRMNMEGEDSMEEDDSHTINMRLRDMLKAARADVTWEEWTELYASDAAQDNMEDFGPYKAARQMTSNLDDLKKLGKSTGDIFKNQKKGTRPEVISLPRNSEQAEAAIHDWDNTVDIDWSEQWELMGLADLTNDGDEHLDEIADAFLAIEYFVPAYNSTKWGRMFFELNIKGRGLTIYELENDDSQVRVVPMTKEQIIKWWTSRQR